MRVFGGHDTVWRPSQHSDGAENAPKYAFRDAKNEKFSGEGALQRRFHRHWGRVCEGDSPRHPLLKPQPHPYPIFSAPAAPLRLGPSKPKSWIRSCGQQINLIFTMSAYCISSLFLFKMHILHQNAPNCTDLYLYFPEIFSGVIPPDHQNGNV